MVSTKKKVRKGFFVFEILNTLDLKLEAKGTAPRYSRQLAWLNNMPIVGLSIVARADYPVAWC